ncbi:hypothetical protein V9K67_10800 [Paraflavisolibacter sp. H34]|uniref:hypothetical protein n=1 Tax=Huijunlia imazamoxiresistens TaxID=3127457 RepID=UPI00301B4517
MYTKNEHLSYPASFPVKKGLLAGLLFTVALCYIISPRILEKALLLNELLSVAGLGLLAYHSFKIKNTAITLGVLGFICLCLFHAVTSLFRMDSIYFYLRNLVIFYSVFAYFAGYYLHEYLTKYISRIFFFLSLYILTFLLIPAPSLYERFGMAVLFPVLLLNLKSRWVPYLLVPINFIYAVTYQSSTAGVIGMFYLFVLLVPGYRFFKQTMLCGFAAFTLLFMYLSPALSVMYDLTMQDDVIRAVRAAHPLLDKDPNNTWRLMLWHQILVDKFPMNLIGMGFGTPLLQYYPIEDISKAASLPYVVGGHNSFVYLYGRLGLLVLVPLALIYRDVLREYFYYKRVYRANQGQLLFFSFFAITVVAVFNPTLETPIFAGSYWLILGLLAKTIEQRKIAAAAVFAA